MMMDAARIDGGFAEVGAGAWLMGCGQPAAFFGAAVRRRRKGLFLGDRQSLDLVETTETASCADAKRPFLTHITCAAPISAVSSKVLVAPASAWRGAQAVKVIPMSSKGAIRVTDFEGEWVVLATESRTMRMKVAEGDTFSVRPESVVAWTGNRPTGFCPSLGIWDIILPRGPRNLLLHFHGPAVVWVEGAKAGGRMLNVGGRFYGA